MLSPPRAVNNELLTGCHLHLLICCLHYTLATIKPIVYNVDTKKDHLILKLRDEIHRVLFTLKLIEMGKESGSMVKITCYSFRGP